VTETGIPENSIPSPHLSRYPPATAGSSASIRISGWKGDSQVGLFARVGGDADLMLRLSVPATEVVIGDGPVHLLLVTSWTRKSFGTCRKAVPSQCRIVPPATRS